MPPRPDSCGQGLWSAQQVGVNAVGLVLVPRPCLHLSFHRGHLFAFALPVIALSLMECLLSWP